MNTEKKIWSRWASVESIPILHPFLLPAYFLLAIYTTNSDSIRLAELGFAGVILFCLAAALWVIFRFILPSSHRSALVVTIWGALFFTFGHVYEVLQPYLVPSGAGGGAEPSEIKRLYWILGGLWTAMFLATPLFAERMSVKTSRVFSEFLTLFTAVLLAFPIASIGYSAIARAYDTQASSQRDVEIIADRVQERYPDLLLIVLDSYARADTLSNQFGHDNGEFISALEKRGFTIPSESRSNYAWSQLSIPSLVNFQYLQSLDTWPGERARNKRFLQEAFSTARLAKELRNRGLAYHHFESTYFVSESSSLADARHACSGGHRSALQRLLLQTTFARLWRQTLVGDLAECHLQQFDRLARVASNDGPKFIFAHFMPPHHPYLFDSAGNVLMTATLSEQFGAQARLWSDRKAYVEQLRFVNTKMIELIDRIERDATRPYILVLASDHGPKVITSSLSVASDYTDHRFRNFVAVLEPGNASSISNTISLVNLPRLILNDHYDGDFPPLKDRFFDSEFNPPYKLDEIRFAEFE